MTAALPSVYCNPIAALTSRMVWRAMALARSAPSRSTSRTSSGLDPLRAGLDPLLVRNPTKAASGHRWPLLDRALAPSAALAGAEYIAPELSVLPERLPHLDRTDVVRLRPRGGVYLPVGAAPGALPGSGAKAGGVNGSGAARRALACVMSISRWSWRRRAG